MDSLSVVVDFIGTFGCQGILVLVSEFFPADARDFLSGVKSLCQKRIEFCRF